MGSKEGRGHQSEKSSSQHRSTTLLSGTFRLMYCRNRRLKKKRRIVEVWISGDVRDLKLSK
jgi:hypothetical protein